MSNIYEESVNCPKCGENYWKFIDLVYTGDRQIIGSRWKCNTLYCDYVRVKKKRKPGVEKTPSQIVKINKVIKWVRDYFNFKEIEELKEEISKYGNIFLYIYAKKTNVWNTLHLSVSIGRRGGITLLHYDYGVGSDYGLFDFQRKFKPNMSLTKKSRSKKRKKKK